jgi:hypothetical protein
MANLNAQFDLLEEADYAKLTNRKLGAVRNERAAGKGPPYIKVGRCVKYRRSDVLAFLAQTTVKPGSSKDPTLIHGTTGRGA